jgi:hypothetical protein
MRSIYLCTLPAFLVFSCGSGEKNNETDKYELVFKPSAGEKKSMIYRFSCVSDADSTNIIFSSDLNLEVKNTKKGMHGLEVNYRTICVTGNQGKNELDICAGDTIPPAIMKTVSSVFSYLHSTYAMQFDDRMRKTNESVVAVDSAVTNVAAPIGKMQFFTVLPSKAVMPGDSWKEELDLSGANKKKAQLTYTLKRVENGIAYISLKGTLNASGEGFGQEFKMTSELEGSIEVDVKTGWTLMAERKEDVSLISAGDTNRVIFTYYLQLK